MFYYFDMKELTHIDEKGKAVMVDISSKPDQQRVANAKGKISLQPDTLRKIMENDIKKGDVLSVARIAGIQAAKATPTLIPLCHNLLLTQVTVDFTYFNEGIEASCVTKCIGPTGVEMEALTGVSVALLTIYDMCKAIDKSMKIFDISLFSKTKV